MGICKSAFCLSDDSEGATGSTAAAPGPGGIQRKDSRTMSGIVPHFHWKNKGAASINLKYEFPSFRALGKGATSVVRVAVEKGSGRKVAVKVLSISNLSSRSLQKLQTEIDILKTLDHPNIVKLLEVYESRSRLYLVMELCTGGELYDGLAACGSYTEHRAADLVKMMLSAIRYCHSKGITHRDLKLENFVFEAKGSSRLKLIDFGLSTSSRASITAINSPAPVDTSASLKAGKLARRTSTARVSRMTTFVGTVYYVAPEMFQGNYDEKVDVWSIGIITFMLLTGRPPFDGETFGDIQRLTGTSVAFTSRDSHVSSSARSFVQKLLARKPASRASAEAALRLDWITSKIDRTDSMVSIPVSVVKSLTHFSTLSALKRTALLLLAQYVAGTDLSDLREIFERLDRDGSGRICFEELVKGLADAGLLKQDGGSEKGGGEGVSPASSEKQRSESASTITRAEAQVIFKSLDQDQSGRIQWTQFLAAMISQTPITQDQAKQLFARLDKDGSGHITISDIRSVLGEEFTKTEAMQIIKEADLNGDGCVSMAEFFEVITNNAMVPKPEDATKLNVINEAAEGKGEAEAEAEAGAEAAVREPELVS